MSTIYVNDEARPLPDGATCRDVVAAVTGREVGDDGRATAGGALGVALALRGEVAPRRPLGGHDPRPRRPPRRRHRRPGRLTVRTDTPANDAEARPRGLVGSDLLHGRAHDHDRGTAATAPASPGMADTVEPLVVAGEPLASRLILGTGGIPSLHALDEALDASGTTLTAVAMRRYSPAESGSLVDLLTVLLATAVTRAHDPARLALAFRHAVEAGYHARRAGRMPRRRHALASSPVQGRAEL